MQAIARVNRVFRDKPGGLVVDYLGLAAELKKALADYTKQDRDNVGIPTEQALELLMEKYEVAVAMFHGFDYPEFRERGWQIGSGPTESQCKLCTKRLKGYGRRWDRPNATAVAALDTLDRNGQWRQVWPTARYVTT